MPSNDSWNAMSFVEAVTDTFLMFDQRSVVLDIEFSWVDFNRIYYFNDAYVLHRVKSKCIEMQNIIKDYKINSNHKFQFKFDVFSCLNILIIQSYLLSVITVKQCPDS